MDKSTGINIIGGDLTLREIILKIKEYLFYLLRQWKYILFAVVAFGAIFYISAVYTPKTYNAKITFMINESEGNTSGVANILGNFGFSSSSRGQYNIDKMLQLSASMAIVSKVLLTKIDLNDTTDYIANYLIREYDYHKLWKKAKNKRLHNFLFDSNDIEKFDRVEKTVLKFLFGRVVGNKSREGFLKKGVSEESGIMHLAVRTTIESLSIQTAEAVFSELSEYYIEQSTDKQRTTYDLMIIKVDSLSGELQKKEFELASFKESNRNMWSEKNRVQEYRLAREVEMLSIIFAEAVKNLEIADFSLRNSTPFIKVIDRPFSPIRPTIASKTIAMAKGIIVGGFLAVLLLVGLKIYRELMNPSGTV